MSQEFTIKNGVRGIDDPELGFVPLIAGGALGNSESITTTTAATWIPEVWLDEIRAFRERNLVLANLVKRVPFEGQVGDVIHIPAMGRLSVAPVTQGAEVTPSPETPGEFTGTITRHRAVPIQVADLPALQSKYDLRMAYTQNGAKVIAEDLDNHIWSLESGFQGGTRYIGSGATAYDPAASGGAGNSADLTAAGLRALINILDNADVPQDSRALVQHPRQKAALLGVDKFTEYQMMGPGQIPIRTGLFGELYGVPVFFSTNGVTLTSNDSVTTHDAGLLLQMDAILLAMQMDVRIQAQYKLEFLSWLVIIDYIGQAFEFRDDHAISIVT